jgi:hypothetical protein
LLFKLISSKDDVKDKPVSVVNLSSKTCILLIVDVDSHCSLGIIVNRCFPPCS